VGLAAYPGTARMARRALSFVFLLAVAIALASAAGEPGWWAAATVTEIERALRIVQALAILALALLFWSYRIPFGRNLGGILAAYGCSWGERSLVDVRLHGREWISAFLVLSEANLLRLSTGNLAAVSLVIQRSPRVASMCDSGTGLSSDCRSNAAPFARNSGVLGKGGELMMEFASVYRRSGAATVVDGGAKGMAASRQLGRGLRPVKKTQPSRAQKNFSPGSSLAPTGNSSRA